MELSSTAYIVVALLILLSGWFCTYHLQRNYPKLTQGEDSLSFLYVACVFFLGSWIGLGATALAASLWPEIFVNNILAALVFMNVAWVLVLLYTSWWYLIVKTAHLFRIIARARMR